MSIINRLDTTAVDQPYLRKLIDEQKFSDAVLDSQNSTPDGRLSTPRISAAYATSGVISGNFTHRGSGQSSYVQSTLASFNQQTLQELANSNGLMTALEEATAFVTSDNPHIMQKQIERYMKWKKDKEVYKEIEKSSEEMAAELERKTAEAAAPKDADGEPIEIAPEISAPTPKAARAPAESSALDAQTSAPLELSGNLPSQVDVPSSTKVDIVI